MQIEFGCCFCDEPVNEDGGSLVLDVGFTAEEPDQWQQWWCHVKCLDKAILPRYRDYREEIEKLI